MTYEEWRNELPTEAWHRANSDPVFDSVLKELFEDCRRRTREAEERRYEAESHVCPNCGTWCSGN